MTRSHVIYALLVVTVLVIFGALYWLSTGRIAYAASACANQGDQPQQIDCWSNIIRGEIRTGGIVDAMDAFSYIYDTYPVFAQTGCHTHAHRVGDMAYYEYYLANPDFDAMEFPQSTASCGYGFYHGFFEHLIQDTPKPEFITETCTYFQNRLGSTLGDIRPICYHGSGHGLALAQAAHVSRDDWGNASVFTHQPLQQCEKLSLATPREKEECQEGVYNVLVDWMETKQYGFVYNKEKPFTVCDAEKEFAWKRACYYEMAQKLDGLAEGSPTRLEKLVLAIDNATLRRTAFQVGAAGIMQRFAGTDEYRKIIPECVMLDAAFATDCVNSVIAGLFEHGSPQHEYESALAACHLDVLAQHADLEKKCWNTIALRLARFYTPEKTLAICTEFPDKYRALCEAHKE